MSNRFIFSWAENINGKMVHIDNVPRGINCRCFCPYCHEELIARQGYIYEHGFAHHSKKRRANLEICYKVTLYKLAEYIIQTKKRIHVPSYYNIFKENDISFVDVKIDNHYEREDKQPDVIATTKDNCQYLIEFIFDYKVQHKKPIDYNHFNCLEIDLSKQTLESLEDFLITSNQDRRWINNNFYFNKIEEKYRNANKPIKVKNEKDCYKCKLINSCCAIKDITIINNGERYRLCKTELYNNTLERELSQNTIANNYDKNNLINNTVIPDKDLNIEKSCFNCKSNLSWANKDGLANCGCYASLGLQKRINPNYANICKNYRKK